MVHITQSDIAKRLNVTRITVSKALRNHPDISTETREKILRIAEELNYTPNLIAKNLISQKTNTIGVVIPDLENNFFAYATDSLIDTAAESNYNVFVTVSREKQENEIQNIKSLIGMRVDGLLVCVSEKTKDREIFNLVKNKNMPLVFFDRKIEGLNFSSISFDDKNGAIFALEQIINKGYKKIAHFAGYQNVSIAQERLSGYKEALEKKGIKINNDWIIEGGFEIKDGYDAFMKLYKNKNLPEIIFTVNDRAAFGAYKAAAEVGLKIPDDIGFVAYGFNETVQTFSPALSIINQNPRKLGRAAVNLLLQEINNNEFDEIKTVLIEEEFLWNNSIKRK
ncbi:MAG: LacI family DNA-binding transcriptional regulator [Melioribacteraceae bacterium]